MRDWSPAKWRTSLKILIMRITRTSRMILPEHRVAYVIQQYAGMQGGSALRVLELEKLVFLKNRLPAG